MLGLILLRLNPRVSWGSELIFILLFLVSKLQKTDSQSSPQYPNLRLNSKLGLTSFDVKTGKNNTVYE